MNAPIISIVIPFYNVEDYLPKTLLSLKKQTIDAELILVNDCSTDDSAIKAKNILSSSDWPAHIAWTILNHATNKGVSVARNSGIEVARGKYLFFVDSDDYLEADALELFLEKAQSWDVDLVIGHAKTSSGELLRTRIPYDRVISGDELHQAYLGHSWIGSPWNKLIKREYLLKHDLLFKPDMLNEDELWNFQLAATGPRTINLDAFTYFYFDDRDGSIMNADVPRKTLKRANMISLMSTEASIYAERHHFSDDPAYCRWISIHLFELLIFIPRDLDMNALARIKYYSWISAQLPHDKHIKGEIHGRLRRALKLCSLPKPISGIALHFYIKQWMRKQDKAIADFI